LQLQQVAGAANSQVFLKYLCRTSSMIPTLLVDTIKYKNGEFIVTGDEWAPDGKHIHKFWSEYSKYENNTLRFVFTSTEGARKLEGSAEYRFSTHGGKPMGFSGFYVENDTGKTTELEGVRAENLVENLEEPRFFDVKFQQKLVDRYVKSASP